MTGQRPGGVGARRSVGTVYRGDYESPGDFRTWAARPIDGRPTAAPQDILRVSVGNITRVVDR